MPISPQRMAELDQYFGDQQQPDYLTKLSPDKPSGLSPERAAQLDTYFNKQNQPHQDAFSTVADQALQGATFGIGNRAQAGLAALVMSGINGKDIAENYKDARNIKSAQMQDEMQNRPVLAIGSNLLGGLATGGLGSGTKAGTTLANSIRSGSTTARVVKGAASGAATGAAYGAGTADYDKSAEGAKQGALIGAATGGVLPIAGDALKTLGKAGKGVIAKSPEAVQDIAESMKSNAGAVYDQMRQVGATFKPSATQGFLQPEVDASLQKLNFIPGLTPQTNAIVEDLRSKIASGDLELSHLDQIRRQLGRVGGNAEEPVAAGAVRRVIDDFVNNANSSFLSNGDKSAIDLLNKGRKQYQQASKYEAVSEILAKADGDQNKIRNGLKRFLDNSENTSGWSDKELAALKDAAKRGVTDNLLRGLGTFGLDLGKTKNIALPLITGGGSFVAPSIGVPLLTAGTVARQLDKYATRGDAQTLLDVLSGNVGKSSQIALPGMNNPAALNSSFNLINQIQNLKNTSRP